MRQLTAVFLLAILASVAAPAQAVISLATDSAAFTDGSGYQWHGSTPFDSGDGLTGYVEWAVYGPGALPGDFVGYTPAAGELTYAYQIFVTGSLPDSAPVAAFKVAIDQPNPAHLAGAFQGGGVWGDDPLSSSFIDVPPSAASWDFAGILPGGSSRGLAFSSPNVPMENAGFVSDHGTSDSFFPLPSPSAEVLVPEASSLVLWFGLGAVGAVFVRRSRRAGRVAG